MIEVKEGVHIDVNHIEALITDIDIFRVQTVSGQTYVVSPRVYEEILKLKKQIDNSVVVRV